MQLVQGISHLAQGSHTKQEGVFRIEALLRYVAIGEAQARSKGLAAGPEAAAWMCIQRCSTWKLCGVGVAKRSRAEQSLERLHRKTTRVSRSLHLHGPE